MYEAVYAGLGGVGISTTKKVKVVQFVIQIVKNLAFCKPRIERVSFLIGLIEIAREPTKHVSKCQFGLPITVISCRIKNKGTAFGIIGSVSSPEIAMKKGRGRSIVAKEKIESCEEGLNLAKFLPFLFREFKLMNQAMSAIKIHPILRLGIRLWSSSDTVVHIPAKKRFLYLMKLG